LIPSDLNISKCNSKPWHWCQEIVHIPSTCKIWDLVGELSVDELDWVDWWTRMKFRWGAIYLGSLCTELWLILVSGCFVSSPYL